MSAVRHSVRAERGSATGDVLLIIGIAVLPAILVGVFQILFQPVVERNPTSAIVVALLAGIALAILVALERKNRRQTGLSLGRRLADAADYLALSVKDQWDKEARKRGLRDEKGRTRLMKVGFVVQSQNSTMGQQRGTVDELGKFFTKLRSQRMIILGPGGAGKTAAAIELALNLLKRRQRRADAEPSPVPVYLSLAAWQPRDTTFGDWLREQLKQEYNGLRNEQRYGLDAAGQLVRRQYVLPVLDDLDELDEPERSRVLEAIQAPQLTVREDEAMTLKDRVLRLLERREPPKVQPDLAGFVLISRDDAGQDEHMTEWANGLDAEVITLQPLKGTQAFEYILDVTGPKGSKPWEQIRGPLADENSRLAALFSSPLMVSLAVDVYSNGDPAELLRGNYERLELRHFIPSILDRAKTKQKLKEHGWKPEQAEEWLANLAVLMRRRNRPDFRWWELTMSCRSLTAPMAALFATLSTWVSTGMGFTLVAGGLIGAAIGLLIAILMGAAAFRSTPRPAEMQMVMSGWTEGMLSGLLVGVVSGAAAYLVTENILKSLPIAVIFALAISLSYGITVPDAKATNPGHLLSRDVYVAYFFGIAYGVPAVLAGWVFERGPVFTIGLGVAFAIQGGLLYGPLWALLQKANRNAGVIAWLHFVFARFYYVFVRRHELPWRLITFLDLAHQFGILRLNGSAYEFRHRKLLDETATER